jgi:hypothetical protein
LDISEAEERLRAYLLEGIGTQILWADLVYELAYGEERDVPENHGVPGSGLGPALLFFNDLQAKPGSKRCLGSRKGLYAPTRVC